MARASQEVRDYVENRFSESKWERNVYKAICEEVREKFNEVLTYDQVRKMCAKIDSIRWKIADINESVKSEKPYEVVGTDYVMKFRDQVWRFPIEEVDAMFYDFSSHGANLSGEQMIQKYELKPEAWTLIKNRLRLYKASNVISPHTAETLWEEELDEKIEEATTRHIDTMKQKMVSTHERKFKEEARKAFRKLGDIDYFLEHLKTFIQSYSPKTVKFDDKAPEAPGEITIAISDIHIGKTETHKVLERLNKVLQYAKNTHAGTVNVLILGDVVETLAQDGMHPGQIAYGTDHQYGKYGFDLMMDTVQIFENFFIELRKSGKKVNVKALTGNHGRMTANKEDDKKRTGELVIFELLKRGLANTDIHVDYYREVLNAFQSGNINYILMHGDGKVGKDSVEKILLTHGKYGMYNVVMWGDWHTYKTHEGKAFTYLRLPWLAGKWEYDTDMNLHSEPWFAVVEENEYGTADITIKRLPN